MPCKESILNAKASFVAAVSDGIDTLIQQCGYSRDRATSALMRELSRGDSTRPSDKEIFDTMAQYSLGIEEASKTIIVSRALRRAMSTASPAKAIEHLASQIAVKRLLYDSSEEDPTSEDEYLQISSDLRVEPISTMEHHASSRARSSPVRKARLVAAKAGRPRKAAATPNKSTVLFRKRSIDEMTSTEKSDDFKPTRSRSESVSEEVSAKIAQQSSGDDTACSADSSSSGVRAAPSVRAKRNHLPEGTESISQPNAKHIRGTDA